MRLPWFISVRNTIAQKVAGSLPSCLCPRHWGWRTVETRRHSLEEFVPIRVECSLPKDASFDYAAASLRAGDDHIVGITEVL